MHRANATGRYGTHTMRVTPIEELCTLRLTGRTRAAVHRASRLSSLRGSCAEVAAVVSAPYNAAEDGGALLKGRRAGGVLSPPWNIWALAGHQGHDCRQYNVPQTLFPGPLTSSLMDVCSRSEKSRECARLCVCGRTSSSVESSALPSMLLPVTAVTATDNDGDFHC